MKISPLRAAGNLERRCIVRHDLGLYGNLIVAGLYQLDLDTNQDYKQVFVAALKRCIVIQPILSASIGEPEERPSYVRPDFLDLNNHITFLPPLTKVVSDKQVTRNFLTSFIDISPRYKSGIPAWRLVVQPLSSSSFWAGFSYCHSVGDGRSGLAFHRSLCQILQQAEVSTTAANMTMTMPTAGIAALPPAMENAVVLPISWGFLLGPLLEVYLPKPLSSFFGLASTTEDKWTAGSYTNNNGKDRVTGIEVVTLDAATTLQLLKACKAHNTKFTGLLHQAIAQSIATALIRVGKVPSPQRTITLSASTPLDLRKLVPQYTTDTIINCASQATETWTITPIPAEGEPLPKNIWTAATTTSAHLATSSSTLSNQVTGLLHYLSNYRSWLSAKLGKPREESFEISNLGVFTSGSVEDDKKRANITHIAFAQPANALGAAIDCGVVSTVEGGLCLTFTWQKDVLDVEDEVGFVEDVVQGVEGFLGRACRG
jgi:hypothetical protein